MTDRHGPVRVAYLASVLGEPGGIPRFMRELLVALDARDDVVVTPVVTADGARTLAELRLRRARPPIVMPARGQVTRSLWERYRLGRVIERTDAEVVHGLKHLLPRTSLPTVLTVHDTMTVTWPQQFRLVKRILLPRQFLASVRSATVLVADSNATRERIGRIDPALTAKTSVGGAGMARALLEATPEPVDSLEGVPFALVVGDLSPRKNLAVLLDIWPDVHAATGLRLVAVAWEAWHSEQTRDHLLALQQQQIAMWARAASDAQLRWCYEHATVVLVPSIEEGFGLPVVEALALGARVVAGDDAALVEVGRGRSLHVPARDAAAWAATITSIAAEPADATARERFEPPSWVDVADATVAAYRRALHSAGRASAPTT